MFRNFYKNEGQINHVTLAISEGRLSHAYIIEGDRGSGKLTFARLTCALLAGGKENPLAAKILEGNSPDVSEYDVPEKKKFITVDTVRQIKYDANIKPNELDIRVFIIKHADAMNTAAQNALLKLLEEPPKNVYFFLLCENPSALLPTVRSRAQCIRMERFDENAIAAYLKKKVPTAPDDAIKRAAARSSGSIGRAIEVLEDEKSVNADGKSGVIAIIEALKNGDYTEVLVASSRIPSERAEAERFLDGARRAVRDMIALSCHTQSVMFFESPEEAKQMAGHLGIRKLLSLEECIARAIKEINLNMNVQTVKICLAKRMMRAVCR